MPMCMRTEKLSEKAGGGFGCLPFLMSCTLFLEAWCLKTTHRPGCTTVSIFMLNVKKVRVPFPRTAAFYLLLSSIALAQRRFYVFARIERDTKY